MDMYARTIMRFPIDLQLIVQCIALPEGAEILGSYPDGNGFAIFALASPSALLEQRRFHVHTLGNGKTKVTVDVRENAKPIGIIATRTCAYLVIDVDGNQKIPFFEKVIQIYRTEDVIEGIVGTSIGGFSMYGSRFHVFML